MIEEQDNIEKDNENANGNVQTTDGETTVTDEETGENGGKKSYLFMFIAMGCFFAGCILFALAFVIKGVGNYMLIASMICELASVSFLNAQKRHVETAACKVLRILSYIVMGAGIIVVIIGMSVVNANK